LRPRASKRRHNFFAAFAEHQGLFHIFHSYGVEMQIVEEL